MDTAVVTRADARKNGSTIKDAIRRAFNYIGRAHVQSGHKIIPVMELDGEVQNYAVTEVTEGYAILTLNDEIYGVTFDA